MKNSNTIKKLFPIVFFLSLILFGLAAFRNPGVDFRGYYGAALLVLRGGNPYDYAQLAPILNEISGFLGNNPYFYPPWYSVAFIPFTFMSFRTAQILWIGVNLSLFYISLEWLWQVLDWKIESWFRWVLFTFANILFGYSSLISENSGFVILFGLALTLRSLKREQHLLAGLGFIIMLTKPQALFMTIIALGLWSFLKRPKVIQWSIAWLGTLLIFSSLIFPRWWQFDKRFFGLGISFYQEGAEGIIGLRVAATLYDWLTYSFGSAVWINAVVIFLIGGFGAFLMIRTWRYLSSPVYIGASATLLTLLITPYTLYYDFVPLILVFFLISKQLQNLERIWLILCVVLLVLAAFIQVIADLQYQMYWVTLFMTAAYTIAIWSRENLQSKTQVD
ncbi:MAG: glycosyltransferase family 87 protein [Anaerolineae bacterium]|nr:glycosyltransferase family 87 protein [Anaerolineae bacterium]